MFLHGVWAGITHLTSQTHQERTAGAGRAKCSGRRRHMSDSTYQHKAEGECAAPSMEFPGARTTQVTQHTTSDVS